MQRARSYWWMTGLAGVAVLLLSLRAYVVLEENLTHTSLVKSQAAGGELQAGNETMWDAGWRRVCSAPTASAWTPVKPETLLDVVETQIDRGAYDAALATLNRAAVEGWIAQSPNATAYRAALQLKWREAVSLYQPERTPRHQRWWGTIFYLAAQQSMFAGQTAESAPFYRQADVLYGTQGPYLGTALVECLQQQNRLTEAWDAYRRALVALPVGEALAHVQAFNALRLAGLEQWHASDPNNVQVTQWLKFYHAAKSDDGTETLKSEPKPQVNVEADLGDRRKLIGFDYHVEDIETGPFMTVDWYMREGETAPRVRRARRTVLNQAPNGAFTWDATPDGIRPVGWHAFVYSPDLKAVHYEDIGGVYRWLCLNSRAIQAAFGLQSLVVPLNEGATYVQGGLDYITGSTRFGHGRTWFGTADVDPYSYLGGAYAQDTVEAMSGLWQPPIGAKRAAVWIFPSNSQGQVCARNLYWFAVPNVSTNQPE